MPPVEAGRARRERFLFPSETLGPLPAGRALHRHRPCSGRCSHRPTGRVRALGHRGAHGLDVGAGLVPARCFLRNAPARPRAAARAAPTQRTDGRSPSVAPCIDGLCVAADARIGRRAGLHAAKAGVCKQTPLRKPTGPSDLCSGQRQRPGRPSSRGCFPQQEPGSLPGFRGTQDAVFALQRLLL